MKRFTTQDIVTIITLIILISGVMFFTVPVQASEKVSLWGPAEPTTQTVPDTTPKQGEAQAQPLNPKSLVDKVETVIQKGEAIEQQGRRLKRLVDR